MKSELEDLAGALRTWLGAVLPQKSKRDELLLRAAAGLQGTAADAREALKGVLADLKLASSDDFSALSRRCSRLQRRLKKLDAVLEKLSQETFEAAPKKRPPGTSPETKARRRSRRSPKKAKNKS